MFHGDTAPQPRLSFSLVESVLGELNPELEKIESDVDAIFHSTISSVEMDHSGASADGTGPEDVKSDLNNEGDTQTPYYPHHEPYNEHTYPPYSSGIEPEWRVPPIQDPFFIHHGFWPEYNQCDFQPIHPNSSAFRPRQNRRATADLDKKRVHKCNYPGNDQNDTIRSRIQQKIFI